MQKRQQPITTHQCRLPYSIFERCRRKRVVVEDRLRERQTTPGLENTEKFPECQFLLLNICQHRSRRDSVRRRITDLVEVVG